MYKKEKTLYIYSIIYSCTCRLYIILQKSMFLNTCDIYLIIDEAIIVIKSSKLLTCIRKGRAINYGNIKGISPNNTIRCSSNSTEFICNFQKLFYYTGMTIHRQEYIQKGVSPNSKLSNYILPRV